MTGKHTIYATSKGSALDHFLRIHPRYRNLRRKDVAAEALRRGWRFYVTTPAGEDEPVKGVSSVVATWRVCPRSLWMVKPLD